MPTRLAFAMLCAFALPAVLHAQQARPPLDQVDGAIANGVFSEARVMLQRWRRENPRPEPEDQARYHLLAGRLTADADSAEDQYLTVAVNYPTSRHAPEALVRLAQARHARNDTTQAVTYLERVLADYPDSDQRPMAVIWLSRVQGAPRSTALCRTLRAVSPGTNPETIELMKAELQRVCGSPAITATTTTTRRPSSDAAPARTDTAPRTNPPAPATSASANAAGKVAIQIGAFRDASGARAERARLQNAGITGVRLVRVPGNQLIRVRVGRYANRAAASAMLARLASADISAVLVTDADSETVVKD